jgi:hypothetical protein
VDDSYLGDGDSTADYETAKAWANERSHEWWEEDALVRAGEAPHQADF